MAISIHLLSHCFIISFLDYIRTILAILVLNKVFGLRDRHHCIQDEGLTFLLAQKSKLKIFFFGP